MVFENINQEHKERLLNYVADWNSNGKHCLAAQVLTTIIIIFTYTIQLKMYFSLF